MKKWNSDRIWRWSMLAVLGAAALGLWRMGDSQAHAEHAAFAPACCVATIDLNSVLATLAEREAREGELKAFIGKYETDLELIGKQGRQAQEDLKILPAGSKEAEAKAEEIIRLGMKLEGDSRLAKALVENKQKKMHLDLFAKILDATKRFADREGYSIVLSSDAEYRIPNSVNGEQAQAAIVGRRVVFASPSQDISQGVAQMMNNEFKAR